MRTSEVYRQSFSWDCIRDMPGNIVGDDATRRNPRRMAPPSNDDARRQQDPADFEEPLPLKVT